MNTITTEQAEAVAEIVDATVYPDYSGRGMYGAECVGWSGDFDEVTLGIALAKVLGVDEAFYLADRASSDSMGRGVIVYLRGVTVEG